MKTGPVRTCVGCRQTAAKAELRRVVLDRGVPVLDDRQRAPGRGAYVHASAACREQALLRKGLARSLRRKIDPAADIGLIKSAQSLHKTDDLAESR